MTEEPASYGKISSPDSLSESRPEPLPDSLPPLDRVFAATECRTQAELADLLGIKQSSIADVKKRRVIPAEWLVKLLRLKGISPEWILTGTGPKRLGPACNERAARVIHYTEIRPPKECSAQELVNELVRRALAAM